MITRERFSDDQHGGVWQEVVGEQGANVPHSDISPWAGYRTPSSPLLAFLISKSAAGMRVRWLLHCLSSRHERMEIGKWEKYSPGVSSMLLLEVFTNSSLRGRRTYNKHCWETGVKGSFSNSISINADVENRILSYLWLASVVVLSVASILVVSVVVGVSVLPVIVVVELLLLQSGVYSSQYQ